MSRRNSRSNNRKVAPKHRNKQRVVFDNKGNPIKNYEDDYQYHTPTGKQSSSTYNSRSAASKDRGEILIDDLVVLEPLTETQAQFFDEYANGSEGFVLYGSAGTGKTMLALYHALEDVLDTDTPYKKVVVVRSIVSIRSPGHLPGELEDKTKPFEAPYIGLCQELLKRKDAYDKLKDMGKIEFVPTSFIKGVTYDNAILIIDEAQNLNFTELSTVLSRLGKNSKIIICGDTKQNDLVYSKTDQSGFGTMLRVSDRMPEFRKFRFNPEDIVRSGFVKSWIMACEAEGV